VTGGRRNRGLGLGLERPDPTGAGPQGLPVGRGTGGGKVGGGTVLTRCIDSSHRDCRATAAQRPSPVGNLAVVVVVTVGGLWELCNHDEGSMATQSAASAASGRLDARGGRRSRLGELPSSSTGTLRSHSVPPSVRGTCRCRRVIIMFLTACRSLRPVSQKHLSLAIFFRASIKPHQPGPARQNSVFMHPSKRPARAGWLAVGRFA
jgi:hypothetical protein